MPRFASMYTYPWDLHDEGIEPALDRIAGDAGANSVSLAVSYHVATYFLPHNPRRKLYYGEDGAIYFQPDLALYARTGIRPRVSSTVTGPDYLPRLVDAIRQRGLDFTAWIVYAYNHDLPARFPDSAKQDVFGNPYPAQLCPASPDFREYALALTRDVVSQCKPDGIHSESLSYLSFSYGFRNPKVLVPIAPFHELLLGLCFCRHCVSAAGRTGLDAPSFKAEIAGYLERKLAAQPVPRDLRPVDESEARNAFGGRLGRYLDARTETATSLLLAVLQIARDAGARTSHHRLGSSLYSGLDPARIAPGINQVTVSLAGNEENLPECIRSIKCSLRSDVQALASLQPATWKSPDEGVALIRRLAEAGIDGFTFYNYGLIRGHHLQWIGAARSCW
ncbi:MAG: hypothetical protein HYU36_16535 [Planctomycetes bacterium]|nr:hypothetical protein [Planctomycetota bacterium]